jgi:hypothetical protein
VDAADEETDVFVARYAASGAGSGDGGGPADTTVETVWRWLLDEPGSQSIADVTIDRAGQVVIAMSDVEEASITRTVTRLITIDQGGQLRWVRQFEGDIPEPGLDPQPTVITTGLNLDAIVCGTMADGKVFAAYFDEPNPVEITSFEATHTGTDVEITWRVAPGLMPLGFDVLHAESSDGSFRRLNADRLPASARSFVHRDAGSGPAFYVLDVIELDGQVYRHGPVAATIGPSVQAPAHVIVHAPGPNPAAREVTFRFELPAATTVELVVIDPAGRVVARPIATTLATGAHEPRWDGRDTGGSIVPHGVYFYRLAIGDEVTTGKIVWNE